MSLASESTKANTLYADLVTQVQERYNVMQEIGWLLNKLKTKNLFKKAVGDMTWREFLAQPEIGIPVRQAEFLIGYYKLCELHGSVIHAPEETLKFLVKNIDEVNEEMLEDAKQLSVRDFKERYYEVKTQDAPKTYEFVVMKRCKETGTLTKEHTVSSAEANKLCLTD